MEPHNYAMSPPVVATCNGSEPLLSSSVPLHAPDVLLIQVTNLLQIYKPAGQLGSKVLPCGNMSQLAVPTGST